MHAREAWASAPRTSAAMMNTQPDAESLGAERPEWQIDTLFGAALRYRFGWRRYLMPQALVRRRLDRSKIREKAKRAYSVPRECVTSTSGLTQCTPDV